MKILVLANNDVGLYQFRKELLQELLKDNSVVLSLPYGEMVEPLREAGCEFHGTADKAVRTLRVLRDCSV